MLVAELVRAAAVSAAVVVQLQGFANVEAFIVPSPATTAVPIRMMLTTSSSSSSRCATSRGKIFSMSAVQVSFRFTFGFHTFMLQGLSPLSPPPRLRDFCENSCKVFPGGYADGTTPD